MPLTRTPDMGRGFIGVCNGQSRTLACCPSRSLECRCRKNPDQRLLKEDPIRIHQRPEAQNSGKVFDRKHLEKPGLLLNASTCKRRSNPGFSPCGSALANLPAHAPLFGASKKNPELRVFILENNTTIDSRDKKKSSRS